MARMKYPGGFADDTPVSPEVLARIFPGLSSEGWEDFATKENLPLRKGERGWTGPALPFLVLLMLKGEPLGAEAYYRLLEKALGDPAVRGELEGVLRKLGNWTGVSPSQPPQPKAAKEDPPPPPAAQEAESQEANPPSPSGAQGRPSAEGPAPAPSLAPSPPPSQGRTGEEASPLDAAISLVVAVIGALEERLRAVEEQVASLRAEVSASREEVVRIQDEMEVWNDHVRYLNDRYAKAEGEIKEEREARKKDFSEVASRLQNLEKLIEQVRRVVLPR